MTNTTDHTPTTPPPADDPTPPGFYHPIYTLPEIADMFINAAADQDNLQGEITATRVAVRRVFQQLHSQLSPADYARLAESIFTGANTLGRLLRAQRAISGQTADGLTGAIAQALDELARMEHRPLSHRHPHLTPDTSPLSPPLDTRPQRRHTIPRPRPPTASQRTDPMNILYLSAEVAPFAKTGGLGDVGGSLPKALRALGHDVRVVMPAYRPIEAALHTGRWDLQPLPGALHVPTGVGVIPAGVLQGALPSSDVPVYFIAERNLFDRPNLYGYGDDPYRFAFYSRAALELTLALNWQPHLLHAHDWHTAPAVTWLATAAQADPRFHHIPSLYTIHNLAHQGLASWDLLNYLGIWTHRLNEESYGQVNLMARGIYHATLINTVSPTYAREITTPQGGLGLDGLLRHRHYDLHGILNGLDYDQWNPATDGRIAARYDLDNLANKAHNKTALQSRANLPHRPGVPLIALISRLDWQKGLDITGHVIHQLMNGGAGDAQFIVLGSGDPQYQAMFASLSAYHPQKMTAFLDYMPELAPLIYAASDLILVPSRFEPCGLTQMIAMRYGSVPVVRATGGLADTVHDLLTGFTFHDYSAQAFWHALQRATYIHNTDPQSWQLIQRNGMSQDFSWARSAVAYQQLYQWAQARIAGP